MKIMNVEKKSFTTQDGRAYTRGYVTYGNDPLVGTFPVSEQTKIYRVIQGYSCLIGTGYQFLKLGMVITPIFFVDRYNNAVLQSVIIEEEA